MLNIALSIPNLDISQVIRLNRIDYRLNPLNAHNFKCEYCGLEFIRTIKDKSRINSKKFCSHKCQVLYYGREKSKQVLKNACANVSNAELREFLKEYNSFAMSEIYKYERWQEDLIELWLANSILILANLKKYKIEKKSIKIKFIKSAIKRWFLNINQKRKKEVFYSDLSMKNQIKILGDVIEERG
ncbi:MAG: hypothetical protein IKW45_03765 [Clostridia bacterium]|nr:hypothetical protein [Clostridia bacterium]